MTRIHWFGFLVVVLALGCSRPPIAKEPAASNGSADAGTIGDGGGSDGMDQPLDCGETRTQCGDACVDVSLDSDNCGGCERPCASGQVCSDGQCTGIPRDCRVEGECPMRYYCDDASGLCKVGCTTNNDCPADAFCDLDTRACLCADAELVVCGGQCTVESPTSCGAECESCPGIANGSAVCENGVCGTSCDDGHLRCGDSCSACPPSDGTVTFACLADACVANECEAGYELCNGTCAACPSVGQGESLGCDGAECVITDCPAGTRLCDGTCADCPATGPGETLGCDGTACVIAGCPAGNQLCGGACAACPSDPNARAVCSGTSCVLDCNPGYHECGGACVADTDPTQCGSSCDVCSDDPNGAPICTAGACSVSCDPGYRLCGGACAACPGGPGVASTTCSGATCEVQACAAGFAPCSTGCCGAPTEGAIYNSQSFRPSIEVDSRGYPHIALSANGVKYVYWDGARWVDEDVAPGSEPTLVLDAQDRAHIAYVDANDELTHARRDANGWTITVVASGVQADVPRIALFGSDLYLAFNEISPDRVSYAKTPAALLSWSVDTISSQPDAGGSVFDPAAPSIIPIGDELHHLFTMSVGGTFGTYEVVQYGVDAPFSLPSYETPTSATSVNGMSAMELAADGKLWFAADKSGQYVREVHVWNTTPSTNFGPPVEIASGQYPSLAIAGSTPYVVYFDSFSGDLMYASESGGWSPVTLDAPGDVGRWNDVAYDPVNHRLHVVYSDQTNFALKYKTFAP